MTEKFSDYLQVVVDGGLLMYQPFLLGVASFAYNCKIHLDMGQTPFEGGHGHPVRFPTGLEMVENSAGRAAGTVGRFRMLQRYVLTMLTMGEEVVPEGQGHQKIGDLAIFLAPFGIHPRQGHWGLEARVRVGSNLTQASLHPDQVQAAPQKNSVGEQKVLVVLPFRRELTWI